MATQVDNHPAECWDIDLTKKKTLYSKCLKFYIEKIKKLKFVEGRRKRREATEIIDQFIFCWSN